MPDEEELCHDFDSKTEDEDSEAVIKEKWFLIENILEMEALESKDD